MSNNAKPFTLFGFGEEYLKTNSISSEYYREKRENDFHFCLRRIIADFKNSCNIDGLGNSRPLASFLLNLMACLRDARFCSS